MIATLLRPFFLPTLSQVLCDLRVEPRGDSKQLLLILIAAAGFYFIFRPVSAISVLWCKCVHTWTRWYTIKSSLSLSSSSTRRKEILPSSTFSIQAVATQVVVAIVVVVVGSSKQ